MSNNIVLIGFMGVGKGSVAREISSRCDIVNIDSDDIIESMSGLSVKKIFEQFGESHFRDLERRVALWMSSSLQDTLISTGGGFFKVESLNKIGTVVLLDASFEKIYERILAHPNAQAKLKKRPLFADLEAARALYAHRAPLYKEVADVVVDTTDRTLEDIAQEIITEVINR